MRDTTTIGNMKRIEGGLEEKPSALSRTAERIKALTDLAHDVFVRQEALANRMFGDEMRSKAMDDEQAKLKAVQSGMVGVIFDNLDLLQEMLAKVAGTCKRLEEAA